jgi:hypothetical protein
MHLLDAMRRTLAGEIVPLHDTSETTTFTCTSHIHPLDVRELINRDLSPDFKVSFPTEFTNELLWLTPCLGNQLNARSSKLLGTLAIQLRNVTTLTATRQTTRLVLKTQLNGLIAISIFTANLQHMTRTRLDNRNRHCLPVLQVNLCHPDFAAED